MEVPVQDFPPDVPVSGTFGAALAGMVDKPFLASRRYEEQQLRALKAGAHPDIVEFVRVFVRAMANLGVPVFAHEIVRTAKRQDELFALGNSKAKGGRSAHQFGLAVDIVHSTKAWGLDKAQWALMRHVALQVIAAKGLAIESNDWSGGQGWDPAHWQLVRWKAAADEYPFPELTVPWSKKARDAALSDAASGRRG